MGSKKVHILSLTLIISILILTCSAQTAEPEPEPEPEGEPEPEAEYKTVKPDHDEPSFAEPEPIWSEAKPKYGVWWQVHVYLFGVSFAVVAIYAILSVFRLSRKRKLFSQPYFISLNVLVFIIGSSRSLYLLIDAYNSRHVFPHVAAYILYSTVFPCVTAAFSLLFFAMLSATKMTFMSEYFQKLPVIITIIAVHFILSITADVLIGVHLDARIILFVCQMFYMAWGVFLFAGFMAVFKKLYKTAKTRQNLLNKHVSRKLGLHNQYHKPHRLTLSLGAIVTLISSILGLITVGLLIYGMADVYGVFQSHKPEAWRWFGYHTAFRTMELSICILISYIATQPFRVTSVNQSENRKCSCIYYLCAPCLYWCQCTETTYMVHEVGWEDFNSESWSEYPDTNHRESKNADHVHRQDSSKGDFPLHHIRRTSNQQPVSPKTNRSMMLTSTHGQLNFSHDNGHAEHLTTVVNPHYYDSTDAMDQPTLKLDREFSYPEADDTDALLTTSDRAASREQLDLIKHAQSLASIDNISQMSPQIPGSDTESENDVAEV